MKQLPTELLSQQLSNGLVLLGLGMGVVFIFLIILIFSTKGMSSIVRKIESVKARKCPVVEKTAASDDAEVAIAIAAAVRKSQQ